MTRSSTVLPEKAHVLFVHGMGRSPLSGWPTLFRLRRQGWHTHTFGYFVCAQSFEAIRDRLVQRLVALCAQGDCIVIGHSLGGVLLRSALAHLPEGTRLPRHLFLLGSPMRPARMAQALGHLLPFRWATGDCGRLLASPERMAGVPPPAIACTHVIGTLGWRGRWSPFGMEPNDGVVALSEACGGGVEREILRPIVHTWLPSHPDIAQIITRHIRPRTSDSE